MLKGVYTALITPFNDDFSLNEEGLIQNIHFQLEHGVDGIVLLGTTAESPTLSLDEQETIIRIGVQEIKKRGAKTSLWIGTGAASTSETIKKTHKAKDLGADGALIVTPYYNRPTQEGLACHFEKIAQECKFPIMVYNIPGRTGQNMETSTLVRLMDQPEIVGVKEASGNINQVMSVIESARPGFAVLSGDDAATLPVIAVGGVGVVSVLSNLIPSLILDLTHSALNQDFSRSKELHYALLPLFRDAFIESNPAPIKALMQHAGMNAGPLRLPLVSISKENATRIIQCYEEMFTLQN